MPNRTTPALNDRGVRELLELTLVRASTSPGSIGTLPPTIDTRNKRELAKHDHWSDVLADALDWQIGIDWSMPLAWNVAQFQRIHGLDVDSIVGPQTWAALGCRDFKNAGERALMHARHMAYLPAREYGGNNKGSHVRRFTPAGTDGYAWCVAFATWCCCKAELDAGTSFPYRERLSTSRLVLEAHKMHKVYTAAPATPVIRGQRVTPLPRIPTVADAPFFVCVLGGSTGAKHTALGHTVAGGYVYVIEGNVRPRKWLPWQYDIVRPGRYKLEDVLWLTVY